MRRAFQLSIATGAFFIISLVGVNHAGATTNNNNLVDDFTFDNVNTLNANQINDFLNGFPNSCISLNSGFAASDPLGYAPNYPHADGKYLYGSPVSAGQVIYDAAVNHGMNPQILLTKLQNEEQLVDGSAGCSSTWRYASAVGYACTDSDTFSHDYSYTGADPFADTSALPTPIYYRNGTAVNSITGSCVNHNVYAGFSEQVVHAAWALSIWRHKSEGLTGWAAVHGNWNHCDDINTCPANMNIPAGWSCYSGLMTQGNFKRCANDNSTVFYDGYATIDRQVLHMDNGATAALYVYTPHIQSFDNIFNGYFGSQYSNDTFSSHPNGAIVTDGRGVYMIDNNTRRLFNTANIYLSYGYNWGMIKAASTGDNNLPLGTPFDTLAPGTIFASTSPGSPVYMMNYYGGTLKKQWMSFASFQALGYHDSNILFIPQAEVPPDTQAGLYTNTLHPSGTLVVSRSEGRIYYIDQNSRDWVLSPWAFDSNYYNWNKVYDATAADLTLAQGTPKDIKQGTMLFSNSGIYLVDYDTSGILKRNVGPWECFSNRLHYSLSDALSMPFQSLPSRTGNLFTC